ncbi:MAG: hypothetical protein U0800_07010 [Isosphaeraceae bacterium]
MTVSTPPETSEAPSRSRENSLQHGFTGAGVVLPADMAREVADRREQYAAQYRPQTLHDHDLIHQAALGIVRFNRLQPMFERRAAQRSEQAARHWPLLRTIEAHERSKRLAHDPPSVVARLKSNIGGVEWLLNEWKLLRMALDTEQGWTPKQVERAQDLAGVPKVHRHLDPAKVRGGSPEERKALADRHVAELERLLGDEELARQDEAERQGIRGQLDGFEDPAFERLMRYEQRALRMHRNAIRELEERLEARDHDEPALPASSPEIIGNDEPTEPARPSVAPPMLGKLTTEEYLARILDPAVIELVPASEVVGPDHPLRRKMAAWIEAAGLDLDVVTAVRGLRGYILRLNSMFDSPARAGPSKKAGWTAGTPPGC